MLWCYLCGRFWYRQKTIIAGTSVSTSSHQYLTGPAISRSRQGLTELVDWPCPECDPDYDPTA